MKSLFLKRKGRISIKELFYQVKKENQNLFYKLYIHRIGTFRFNWHKEIELNIILKGKVEVCVEGKKYILKEDDCILINSNSGHATLSKEPGSISMVLHIDPVYFKAYFKEYESLRFENAISVSKEKNKRCMAIKYLLASLINELKKSQEENQITSDAIFSLVITNLIGTFSSATDKDTKIKNSKSQMKVISKALKYIEEAHKEKISLNKIAYILGYNPSYVSQFFKINIGINYYEYLTRVRTREATFDLIKTNRSISDIALEHGFSDVKSFNKSFKENLGRSPNQYRSEVKDNDQIKQLLVGRVFIHEDDAYVNNKLNKYSNLLDDNLLLMNKINLKEKNRIEEEQEITKYKDKVIELEKNIQELTQKLELMRSILN